LRTRKKEGLLPAKKAISLDQAARLTKAILELADQLASIIGPIDAAQDSRRSASFRAEGDRVVVMVTQLALAQNLEIPDIPVEIMSNEMNQARHLQPVADGLAALLNSVDNAVLAAEGTCWEVANAYYEALVRMSATDPALRAALRPVADYFGGVHGEGRGNIPSA